MFSRSSGFDRALEKATSQLLLEPDWDSTMQICDIIRQGDVQPKYAVGAMKRKISSENPHVEVYALQVLESCVKNCGTLIHEEIATKEFMEFLKDLVKVRPDIVKAKILELIQVWSHAFRNEPNYKVVQDTYNLMKLEGHSFPTLKEADAMFMAEKAPEWKEGDCCNRCRTKFGMVNRQHHCRNCGEVFCGKCSSKSSIIPKFGIEKEVRVCDSCFDILNKSAVKKSEGDELPAEYLASPLSKQPQVNSPPKKTEQEIQEEEELQLALAISQSEAESKQKERERLRSNYGVYGGSSASTTTNKTTTHSQPATVSAPMVDTEDMDPELARYLNRNYWQQKSETKNTNVPTTTPSAPVVTTELHNTKDGGKVVIEAYQNGEHEEDEEQFLKALQSSLEIFVNRMRSNSQRGRSIATDSSVQSLFNVISNMHPQLMKYIGKQEDLRGNYEALQDKLAQLRDAREALDALREDHREKRRRELEELERQRQIQMAHKLDIMRQKKHEYLEMQRQLALQRLQEQEREMQIRLEQQKHMTQIRQMQNYGYHQPGYGPLPLGVVQPQQTFNPMVSSDGSPVHQMHQHPQGYGHHMGQGQPQMYNQNTPLGYSQAGGQYQPQTTSQTGQQYQPGPYQQPMSTQPSNLPGTYDSQAGYPTGGQYGPIPQGGIPSTSMPQQQGISQPPGIPMGQGYQGPPTTDYQAFNMQGMANALPQQQYSSQPQQYIGNPPGQYQQPPPQGPHPEQPQRPPPGSNEAQLISFD